MIARSQAAGGSKRVRQAYSVQALMDRYRASRVLGHAVNFARGVLIGGVIVVFLWLTVG